MCVIGSSLRFALVKCVSLGFSEVCFGTVCHWEFSEVCLGTVCVIGSSLRFALVKCVSLGVL